MPGVETMNSRQDHILRVLSSITVGTMAFCLTVPTVMILGGILFAPWLRSDSFFPTQLAVLIFVSIAAGVVMGVAVGTKYYRYTGKN